MPYDIFEQLILHAMAIFTDFAFNGRHATPVRDALHASRRPAMMRR